MAPQKQPPTTQPAPESLLPLTPAAFELLVALGDGDKHGWAIQKQVAERTGDRVRLSPGTLYGLIKRLRGQGLIAESAERPPARWDDERRRYYRLTELGREVARAEALRMERAVEAAQAIFRSLEPVEG